LAERWIKGFEEGFGRKPTPDEAAEENKMEQEAAIRRAVSD
jgi:hypothetical protein